MPLYVLKWWLSLTLKMEGAIKNETMIGAIKNETKNETKVPVL